MKQARLVLSFLVFLASADLCAHGQETPESQSKEPAAGTVEDVGLTTVYLTDDEGNLVPVPGFSYERYRELVLAADRAGVEPPPFVIEKISLKGTATDRLYECEAEIVIHVRKSGWVMVPLRLTRSVLRGAITSSTDPPVAKSEDAENVEAPQAAERPVEFIHRYDPKEGHLLWLGGSKQRRHTLRLPLSMRLAQTAGATQLALALPKASDARVAIEVVGALADATLKSGDGLVETAVRETGTQISVAGAAGDLELSWRREEMESKRLFDLDATSELKVQVENGDTIGFTADIKVSRLGTPIRKLFVRLPPQAEFNSRATRGFTAVMAQPEDLSEAGFDPQRLAGSVVVRVEFEQPAENVEFALAASYKSPASGLRTPVETGGFEVLGAGRQMGFVSIYLPAGFSLKATPDSATFRSDDLSSPAGQARANARYRFVRQPFSLRVDLAPQPPRTVVEPSWLATVQPQRIILAGTLEYQVRGPRPAFLEIDTGDWRLEAAGPESLVELEPAVEGKTVRLMLQPGSSSEFTVQLQLHREVVADAVELAFGLPQVLATQILPATLAVSVADNVSLSPQGDEIRALVPETRLPALPATADARPFTYRELPAAAERPRFVGNFQVRKRRVTTTIEGHAQLAQNGANLEQKLSLQVAYEPLSVLLLDGPADAVLTNLKVTLAGQLLDVREEGLSNLPSASKRRWRVELPQPVSGQVDLVVGYSVSLAAEGNLRLPLLATAEGEGIVTASQRLIIESRGPTQVVLAEQHADDPSLSSSDSPGGVTLAWPKRVTSVELERLATTRIAGPELRIEKQWLQTWLTPSLRRDRYVAQIAGLEDQFTVTLPQAVVADEITALIDGQPPVSLSIRQHSLVIGLEPSSERVRTLELWYLLPWSSSNLLPARKLLELPRIARAATPMQSWVQVLTPTSEQVLYSPSPVTAEQTWRKRGWLWQRGGTLTTPELEAWAGVGHDSDLPQKANDALFMTLGPLGSMEIVVWGRRWLWACVAGGVLLAGVVAHYLSRGRSAILVAALLSGSLIAALISPELALNVSQFAGVGLLLFFGYAWSRHVTGVPPGQLRPVPAPASTVMRTAPPQVNELSGRRDSSLTPSRAALAQTASEEVLR